MKPLLSVAVLCFVYAFALPVPGAVAAEIAPLTNAVMAAVSVVPTVPAASVNQTVVEQPFGVRVLALALDTTVIKQVCSRPAALAVETVAQDDPEVRAGGVLLNAKTAARSRVAVDVLHGL